MTINELLKEEIQKLEVDLEPALARRDAASSEMEKACEAVNGISAVLTRLRALRQAYELLGGQAQ